MALRIDGRTRLVGLLGYPVEHSLSPALQNAAFEAAALNYCYVPLPVAPAQIGAALTGLAALGFVGANVTRPHKQAVMPHLDELSADAQAIGAVNTIVFGDGRRVGHNVDGVGFLAALSALTESDVQVEGRRALVLGAGGAARSVVYALAKGGAAVTVLNRTSDHAHALIDGLRRALPESQLVGGPLIREAIAEAALHVDLVVNATSVGMSPHEDASPWPQELSFPAGAVAYDLIYAPAESRFLKMARAAGARTLNGLPMLVQQGAAAFRLWTGQPAPLDAMFSAVMNGGAIR
jgi:shikimate dehydrogenase